MVPLSSGYKTMNGQFFLIVECISYDICSGGFKMYVCGVQNYTTYICHIKLIQHVYVL